MKKIIALIMCITMVLGMSISTYAQEGIPASLYGSAWYHEPVEGSVVSTVEIYNGDGSDVQVLTGKQLKNQYGPNITNIVHSLYGDESVLNGTTTTFVNEDAYVVAPFDGIVAIGYNKNTTDGCFGDIFAYVKKGDKIRMIPDFLRYNDINTAAYSMYLSPTELVDAVILSEKRANKIEKTLGQIRVPITHWELPEGRHPSDYERESITLLYGTNVPNPEIYPVNPDGMEGYELDAKRKEAEEKYGDDGEGWFNEDGYQPEYLSKAFYVSDISTLRYSLVGGRNKLCDRGETERLEDGSLRYITYDCFVVSRDTYYNHNIELIDNLLYMDGYKLMYNKHYQARENPDYLFVNVD
ncbi:hypothetical protein [Clostridium transplantifaecale]|uniref:hypothetical protein n=1 Tax=Clostridium transplantifaecale TaxID=2479838 RepID=UPI000F63D303|nr:hypothetical protein [Clostridium transplantifaecale]